MTWIRPVGTRHIWQRRETEQVRHHLAFSFRIELSRLGLPVLQIRPTVHFTTMDGAAVDSGRNVRRAKAVRRTWYNDKWLARISAIGSYIADGAQSWKISPSLGTAVSAVPLSLTVSSRLDEGARALALNLDEVSDSDEDNIIIDDLDDEELDE